MHIETTNYRVFIARAEADVLRAQEFRGRVFRGYTDGAADYDAFDKNYQHVLIETQDTNRLVGCFRVLLVPDGAGVDTSYSALFYGLDKFAALSGAKMEIGRFCIDPTVSDPNLLRVAWAAITQMVDAHNVEYLFGCSSFPGTQADGYRDAFALLKTRHLAPEVWRPVVKAAHTYAFATTLADVRPSISDANKSLPALLRTYLSLGGLVSDHAVIDADLNTLHVFTSVAIATIPDKRKQTLRALI